jgi:hypothetical protein
MTKSSWKFSFKYLFLTSLNNHIWSKRREKKIDFILLNKSHVIIYHSFSTYRQNISIQKKCVRKKTPWSLSIWSKLDCYNKMRMIKKNTMRLWGMTSYTVKRREENTRQYEMFICLYKSAIFTKVDHWICHLVDEILVHLYAHSERKYEMKLYSI